MINETNKPIAIIGNPNCGKTTLFNQLTGGVQRVGNWPGVTVEKKEGPVKFNNRTLTLVDLPGIYSLDAQSEDERVARDYLLGNEVQLVINIIDATNLERNLYLTTQLLELQKPLLLVVNMLDLAKKKGITVDLDALAKKLGVPVIGVTATNKSSIIPILELLDKTYDKPSVPVANLLEYSNTMSKYAQELEAVSATLAKNLNAPSAWVMLKLVESDSYIIEQALKLDSSIELVLTKIKATISKDFGSDADVVVANARYEFIQALSRDLYQVPFAEETMSDKIDKIALHRILGIPIFLAITYLILWITMAVGGSFIDFFETFTGVFVVDGLGHLLTAIHMPDFLVTIIAGGIGAGIQTLSGFIPVVFVMFFCLSILEDSGYMARAAFVMDRFLRWIGLPGKSFVPMIVGFGCGVPAIMGTRTLDNKRDRYLTCFMIPLMSCGARLPVYALFGAAFFSRSAGVMIFSLYIVGIILAILTGLLLKNSLFKGDASHFIMELPAYHRPRMKTILPYTWSRLKVFMLRTKLIIVVVAILGFLNSMGIDGSFGNEDSEKSVLANIGRSITPVFTPMGVEDDNWPATVGIFTGLFAKEVIIGTLNSLYGQIDYSSNQIEASDDEEEFNFVEGIVGALATIPEALSEVGANFVDIFGLRVLDGDLDQIAEDVEVDSTIYNALQHYFSKGKWQAYAYLLFVLIYFPCVAAMGAMAREIGGYYTAISMVYLTLLAWAVATLFYQVVVGHQIGWISCALVLLLAIVAIMVMLGRTKLDEKDQNI